MSDLRLVDACTDEHFAAMSAIHCRGWRKAYPGFVPDDYLRDVTTEEHWIPFFREDYLTGRCHGLLLYDGETPVGCINYAPARTENYNAGEEGATFPNDAYQGWGEIVSFYTEPALCSRGYGSLLVEEACRRLKADGFRDAFVFVLRENEGARRFYSRHGFSWDGTHADIPFPHDMVCVDLRYVRSL